MDYHRPRYRQDKRRYHVDIGKESSGEDRDIQQSELDASHAASHSLPRSAVLGTLDKRHYTDRPGVEGYGTRAFRQDHRHPLVSHKPWYLDGALSHRRAPGGRYDVHLCSAVKNRMSNDGIIRGI